MYAHIARMCKKQEARQGEHITSKDDPDILGTR